MFWIVKKIFWIGVIGAIVYYGLTYRINERPIKDYVIEFYNSALFQSVAKAGKEAVSEFFDENLGSKSPLGNDETVSGATPDELTRQDKQALDRVIEKQN